MSTGSTRRDWKGRLMRSATVGATAIALLTVGLTLGRNPSQASAAIEPTPSVIRYAGIEPTLEGDATIIGETGKPSITIDPIESSGASV